MKEVKNEMCRLYYLIKQAEKNKDLTSIEEIIHRFEPKIKSSSKFIQNREREDLEQELKIRIVKAVDKFKTSKTPGFIEFVSKLSEDNDNN